MVKFNIIFNRIGSDIWLNCRLKGIYKQLKYLKNKKILDAGCREGYIGSLFLEDNKVTFVDIEEKHLKNIKKHKNAIITKTDKLPFKRNYFDVIICSDVLEHIKEDKKVIKNLLDILKKDGILVLTNPAYSRYYGEHDRLIGHYRRYDKKDYLNIAKENALEIVKIKYLASLIFLPFILSQKFKKSKSLYEGNSKLERKIVWLLNSLCWIDAKLNLPFGICIMGIFKKN